MKSEYIKPSAYREICRYMTYENALCLRLSLATGLRVGDCLRVRAEDFKGRTLHYVAEKTGKAGKKVLDKKLVDELKRAAGGSGFVFKHRLDPNKHRTRQTVWRDVKRACKAAGISANVTPHSARKTYAVTIFDEYGLERCEHELQHDRLDTTMLYAFSNLLDRSTRSETAPPSSDTSLYEICFRACSDALAQFAAACGFTNSGLSSRMNVRKKN